MYRNDYLKNKKKDMNNSFKSHNTINQINNSSEASSSKEVPFLDNEYKEIEEDEKKEMDNNWLFRLNVLLEENRYYSVQIVFIFSLIIFNLTFWTSSISNRHKLSKFWSAMNNCFGKIIHVFSIGCIMHLTFLDKLKFIQKIFSFKIQTYIGRNTYGIYLIHAYLIIFLLFEYQTYYYLKITDLFILSFGIFAIAWLLSFVLGLLIESPVIYLSKLLNSPDKKKKKKSPLEEKIIDDDEENKLK
jgi:peptidoglycan/LPS O-acetylase OafA/YrhL